MTPNRWKRFLFVFHTFSIFDKRAISFQTVKFYFLLFTSFCENSPETELLWNFFKSLSHVIKENHLWNKIFWLISALKVSCKWSKLWTSFLEQKQFPFSKKRIKFQSYIRRVICYPLVFWLSKLWYTASLVAFLVIVFLVIVFLVVFLKSWIENFYQLWVQISKVVDVRDELWIKKMRCQRSSNTH